MAYVFISHASKDKPRVRPLAKALAFEGLNLWLDRAGHGGSHFNFDQEFVARYGIRELRTGVPWDQEISCALREAGAVLVCISRALCKERTILVQEMSLGALTGKLAACIVDDLPYDEIPTDLGLINASRLQAERIDSNLLDLAAGEVELGHAVDSLAPQLRSQWEIVRKLSADIRGIFDKTGVETATPADIRRACADLARYPIGPAVSAINIPAELISLFADRFGEPQRAQRFVSLAMQIRAECNTEAFEQRQILVQPGEVLPAGAVPAEAYWTDVLTVAGMKSRRTIAALMIAPGAPLKNAVSPQLGAIHEKFLTWLRNPPAA